MKICYIACALNCKLDFVPDKKDYVIGADKGYLNLLKNDIDPNCVIGDFDSYTDPIKCETIIRYPVKKDFTDSSLAIEHAVSKGYRKIIVYGAIGGLLDHTLANIALLADFTERGVEIAFVDGKNVIFAVHNGRVSFDEDAKGRISVFSFKDKADGVYESGLMYELKNATLENHIPLGVSNEFIGKESEISVKKGTLIIYTSKENFEKHLTRD
jgi:thiamine pyrophosphokinase